MSRVPKALRRPTPNPSRPHRHPGAGRDPERLSAGVSGRKLGPGSCQGWQALGQYRGSMIREFFNEKPKQF